MPQIAPERFDKILTKNVTPHILVNCGAIFAPICKYHTILKSLDIDLNGFEANLNQNQWTNEKSPLEN